MKFKGELYNNYSLIVNDDDKFGFVDKDNKEIIPAIYESAGVFDCYGKVRVRLNKKWTWLNYKNEEVQVIENKEKDTFRHKIGDTVKFNYKDEVTSAKIVSINADKKTFTVVIDDKKVWRRWEWII